MKKTIIKTLLAFAGLFILLVASGLIYLKTALPNVGKAPEMTIEGTPQQMERGKYLANHVMACIECHSGRDWSVFAAPLVPGTEGEGGELHDQRLGFPGKYVSGNITPANLGSWTDGEIFRAITTGVSKNGRALFPIMPYHNFGQLDAEDIKSVIAYIRTLEPIEKETEKSISDFPMNFIINTMPKKAELKPMPPKENLVEYGKYLTTAGVCYACHTNQEKGKYIGKDFAGGFEFPLPDRSVVRAMNITPHATGIGNWTVEQFVGKFKAFADSSYVHPKVKKGDFQTVMPWTTYAGMTEQDLTAIYSYLKTIEPAENVVERFTSRNE